VTYLALVLALALLEIVSVVIAVTAVLLEIVVQRVGCGQAVDNLRIESLLDELVLGFFVPDDDDVILRGPAEVVDVRA
jgi:hypothetical protein